MSWSQGGRPDKPASLWQVEYSAEFWDQLDELMKISDDAGKLQTAADWILRHNPWRGAPAYPGSAVWLLHRTNKRGIRLALAYEIDAENQSVYVLAIRAAGPDLRPM